MLYRKLDMENAVLTKDIEDDIQEYIMVLNQNEECYYADCLIGQLRASINSAYNSGLISKATFDELFEYYIYGGIFDGEDN